MHWEILERGILSYWNSVLTWRQYSSKWKTALNSPLQKQTWKCSTTLKHCLEINYQMTTATLVTYCPQGIYLLLLFFAKSFMTNNNGLHNFIFGRGNAHPAVSLNLLHLLLQSAPRPSPPLFLHKYLIFSKVERQYFEKHVPRLRWKKKLIHRSLQKFYIFGLP